MKRAGAAWRWCSRGIRTGGQLWPFGAFVLLQQPVVAGLHRIGETWLYVSCGTGYWGPPMRLGAPAEVTLLTLRVA